MDQPTALVCDGGGRTGRWPHWLGVGFVAGALFVLMLARPGTVPVPGIRPPFAGLDKWLHAFDYAVLAFVLGGAVRERPRPVVRAWGGATAYGLALEALQWNVPYRVFSLGDVTANLVGAGVGGGLWYGSVLIRRQVRAGQQG